MSKHAHDGGIAERRLRPIYDWLDNGNNKKALQEAEKVLKKTPSLQAARALKALALFRLGKSTEAHAVLDPLAEEKPSDDTTLQAMTIAYREAQQMPKVCALYEAAVKAEPTNEELHSHLFMSYVRVGDYLAQQRAAMALYKFAPKNPYYFWAVMSIVMQAKISLDDSRRGILLTLAQRMIDNFISDNKMEAEQEARLYIMILELQDKWEDVLAFIESPLYSQLVPGSLAQASIPYLRRLGLWKRLNIICKELLYDSPDRWDFYLPYLESVFQLMKEPNQEDNLDDSAEKCHEFICQLVESMGAGRTLRGPYLARLELWKRLSVDSDPTPLLGSGVALCLQYLRVFGHKPCAVPDLRQYIATIPQKEREESCKDFLTILGFDENSEPETADDIQRHLTCFAAWRLTAPPATAEVNLTLANTLRRHYLRSLSKGLVTATITEFCTVDGYAVLAAHYYFDAAMQQESPEPVVEALRLLELALHRSPANFHIKLLLVKLYHVLGNALAADTIYQKLEVKHIQLVSLGWLHGACLAAACAHARGLQILADTRAFHHHHAKDSVEHITYAYKYGTFEKLVELCAWRGRLSSCVWSASAARERVLLAVLAGPAAPLCDVTPLTHLSYDNRDLEAIVNYEPPQNIDPLLKKRTFEKDLDYMRLKDGLVSAIALCIECAENRAENEKRQQYEELKTCIDAFSEAMDKCKDVYKAKEKISISAPFPSRIIALVNSQVPYRELYHTTLHMVGELSMGNSKSAHALCERAAGGVRAAAGSLRDELSAGALWDVRGDLELLHNYLEFIGVITFLLGVCNDIVAPMNAKTKRPKKKANQSPEEVKTTELLNELNQTVQDSINNVEEIFDNLPKYVFEDTLEEEFRKLNIADKYQSPVENKLRQGQQDMVNDVKNVLKKKEKYLKSLVH